MLSAKDRDSDHLVHQTSHKQEPGLRLSPPSRLLRTSGNIQTQSDALHAGPSRNPANSIPARIVGLQYWGAVSEENAGPVMVVVGLVRLSSTVGKGWVYVR